ncbi:bifunctional 3'-5' exonuclease/DNA polymerase [Microbacterium oryzae]|uniref:bifunctional 3'-5' exonuclease/DNA polymerase n=1 Tax=Microbacterium oryzae TaxID=743009 RepID=UPI0025AF3505|nr:bifunctional 3'-5' exonuclease/DNA polymerase [Microbacterium oryzae]MDN3311683.1 bifunctional 3'-5' exonuclease/DNA polymerase [Microbacterium oryzae]
MRLHPRSHRGVRALTPSIALGREGDAVVAISLDDGVVRERVADAADGRGVAAWVGRREAQDRPRWVWSDTAQWYPRLLEHGVRVERCDDLRLRHRILHHAVTPDALAHPWDAAPLAAEPAAAPALFEVAARADESALDDLAATVDEWRTQQEIAARALDPGRMRLLLAAESAGALVAAEMRAAGIPWDARRHDELLTSALGARRSGGLPARMEEAAAQVREALDDPRASLDSPPKLLRALRSVGVFVESTSKWELRQHDHPVVAPLLEYKRMARLLAANGWGWLDEWVREGRFRPVYLPGGVVTGRWASSGGGALQIPRSLREAVRADPGWRIVSADVAQLEPRVLAAMARDERMARAAAGADFYEGVVASGAVATRSEAKSAVLGAMYGATQGDAGRLVPRLRKVFPDAMALVDAAARAGEDGGVVRTRLGRTSPAPEEAWRELQAKASGAEASAALVAGARRAARDRGRFTRNFVVQGTAAEWSLAWLADLRLRLTALGTVSDADAAAPSGPAFAHRPHLAFFLHDEVLVHTPERFAEDVAMAIRAAADSAGRLLFGGFPIDFPVDVRVERSAAK